MQTAHLPGRTGVSVNSGISQHSLPYSFMRVSRAAYKAETERPLKIISADSLSGGESLVTKEFTVFVFAVIVFAGT